MTSVTNPSYGFGFANAESLRQAAAERNIDDALTANVRQAAAQGSLMAGTTITARYQFKVGQDGSLVPLSTQITTTAPYADDDAGGQGTRRGGRNDQRAAQLADLLKPKTSLSPTDESAVFAINLEGLRRSTTLKTQYTLSPIVNVSTAAVEDETGSIVEAEIYSPVPEGAQVTAKAAPFAPGAQMAVAGLYARNYSVTYGVEPLNEFAV